MNFKNLLVIKYSRGWKIYAKIFLTYALVGIVAYLSSHYSNYIEPFSLVVLGISLSFLVIFSYVVAAFAILRSLFFVNVGLTFVLFIADQYCKLPLAERTANQALAGLIEISVIALLIQFAINLYKELFGNSEAKDEYSKRGVFQNLRQVNQGKHSFLLLSFFALSMGALLGQIFEVLYPIFINICVYK